MRLSNHHPTHKELSCPASGLQTQPWPSARSIPPSRLIWTPYGSTLEIDADGKRPGWAGLGDLLDTEGVDLTAADGRYSGFSFRLDMRKASEAVIRLHLAEAVREERASGKKGRQQA